MTREELADRYFAIYKRLAAAGHKCESPPMRLISRRGWVLRGGWVYGVECLRDDTPAQPGSLRAIHDGGRPSYGTI